MLPPSGCDNISTVSLHKWKREVKDSTLSATLKSPSTSGDQKRKPPLIGISLAFDRLGYYRKLRSLDSSMNLLVEAIK